MNITGEACAWVDEAVAASSTTEVVVAIPVPVVGFVAMK